MENTFVLDLIKKDLEELKNLVDSLQKSKNQQQLLIDITKAKAKTLLQELELLQADSSEKEKIPETPIEKKTPISEKINTEEKIISIPPIIEEEKTPIIEETPLIKEEITIEEEVTIEKEIVKETPIIETPTISEPEEEITNQKEEIITEPIISELQTKENQAHETEQVVTNIKVETRQEVHEEIIEIKSETAKTEEKEEHKLLGEKFTKELSLYDKLSEHKAESKIKGKPITNLKAAIGLNDRFMYTRELFSNNQSRFIETVDKIDSLSSFEDAINYLQQNFTWSENEVSLKFIDLVKRRFEN